MNDFETLDPPSTIKAELPATDRQLAFVAQKRHEITQILNGQDPRLMLIVGPCSIHDSISAIEYASNLRALAEEVSDSFLIVMRTYFEKPRTSLGWKGMLYDPHLDNSNNILAGIKQARALLLTLAELEMPTATEFLDPITSQYIGDLISWGCIGARTTESQIHRQFASGLDMPVAFKNSTSGNVDIAIQGALVALHPHSFLGMNEKGQISILHTKGNPHSHIALRGGEGRPNYDESSITSILNRLKQAGLPQRIIIDCSHDNSTRQHEKQIDVFRSVIEQAVDGNNAIRGLAIESHINGGSQQFHADRSLMKYAVSLTDPCLDWTTTEQLILWGAARLLKNSKTHISDFCAK